MSKNTSISLGDYFDNFIGEQLNEGRFKSANEVVRAGLRLLEDNETQLTLLRKCLALGEEQAAAGEFSNYSLDGFISKLDKIKR